MRYEDLVLDLRGVADHLAAWLGIALDAATVAANRGALAHHITS